MNGNKWDREAAWKEFVGPVEIRNLVVVVIQDKDRSLILVYGDSQYEGQPQNEKARGSTPCERTFIDIAYLLHVRIARTTEWHLRDDSSGPTPPGA